MILELLTLQCTKMGMTGAGASPGAPYKMSPKSLVETQVGRRRCLRCRCYYLITPDWIAKSMIWSGFQFPGPKECWIVSQTSSMLLSLGWCQQLAFWRSSLQAGRQEGGCGRSQAREPGVGAWGDKEAGGRRGEAGGEAAKIRLGMNWLSLFHFTFPFGGQL